MRGLQWKGGKKYVFWGVGLHEAWVYLSTEHSCLCFPEGHPLFHVYFGCLVWNTWRLHWHWWSYKVSAFSCLSYFPVPCPSGAPVGRKICGQPWEWCMGRRQRHSDRDGAFVTGSLELDRKRIKQPATPGSKEAKNQANKSADSPGTK